LSTPKNPAGEELATPPGSATPESAWQAPPFPDGSPLPQGMLAGAPAQMVAAFQASFWSGPTPRAEELNKYNGVIDGGANRIMELIETQTGHRQELERKDVEADISLRKLGLIFAFSLALIATVGGLALIAVGDNVGAFGPILTAIAVLAGVFVWWEKNRSDRGSSPTEQERNNG
jgi:uncharacterized membrane protein